MSSRKLSTVAAGAAIISAGTLISRLLGYVREKLLLGMFGDSDILGAYNLAFALPDLFYFLLAGGALSAAFIPIFTGYLSKGNQEDADRTGSSIASLLLLVMSACAILGIIFAPYPIRLLQAFSNPDQQLSDEAIQLTISLTRIMCVMIVFTAQSGLFTGILNSYKHFLVPVIVWNVYNIVIILGITVFTKLPLFGGSPENPNIHGVAYSVVIGAFFLAAIQIPFAFKHGFRFSPIIDLAHGGVRKVLKLFGPVMVSLAASQINLMWIPLLIGAAVCGYPAVTDIRAANRLVLLPFGLFAVAISTASFPRLAQLISLGETEQFRRTLSQSIKAILLLSVPSAMAMFVLSEPMTYLLWSGGEFGKTGVQASAFVLMFFSWSLLGLGIAQIVNRAYYSLHDMLTPTYVSVAMVLVNIPLSWFFATLTVGDSGRVLSYGGIALATSLTLNISTLILIELLRRKIGGIDGRSILIMTMKVFVAAVVMGFVMYYAAIQLAPVIDNVKAGPVFRWPAPFVPFSRPELGTIPKLIVPHKALVLQVGISGLAGLLAYLGMLWVLRVEELNLILERFTRRFRRRSAPVTVEDTPSQDISEL
ncbi:MAG: murein biosynthesis integral membrane protein MurJ [Armatimonadota bacterium]